MHTKFWLGNSEQKKPLIRPRGRWEDNTGMNLKETGWEIVDWIHLTQDMNQWRTLVNMVMIHRIP
jgi:hypothetical protein